MSKSTDNRDPSTSDDFFREGLRARELVARLIEDEKRAPLLPEPRFICITVL
jgi:hypothetical protein